MTLRIVQGLAVGGEWAGATLLAAENAPKAKRGKYALYPQLGPSVAFALSSATFLVTALTMSNDAFLSWGWRLPFIGSILLVGLGLYVRLELPHSTNTGAGLSYNLAGVRRPGRRRRRRLHVPLLGSAPSLKIVGGPR